MGYYTNFDLTMHPAQTQEQEREIIRHIISLMDYVEPERVSEGEIEWFLADAMKWYDHEEHMVKISKRYPDVIFVLHGEGEEHGDLWNEYYSNGEYERVDAVITFPEPSNLKFKNLV